MDVCRSDLPTSFRITGSRATAYATRDVMKSIFNPSLIADKTITRSDIRDVEIPHDSSETIKSMDEIQPPTPIPFYPDQLGWQYQVSRSQIKSNPIYKKFHEFLVAETEVGNISRQEVVSMIPVLLLDVKPGMNCLGNFCLSNSK